MKDWNTLEADENRILTTHYTEGRNGAKINKVIIHHNGGNLSIAGCYSVWQTRPASAHYQVDQNGRIGQLVWDTNTAWHAGNWNANITSIGIEHADISSNPWSCSEATIDNGAHLVAAVCKYYGLGRPEWGKNLFGHSDFCSTACLPIRTTELLTPSGWKKLQDIQIGDYVASARFDDQEILFTPVRALVPVHKESCWTSRDLEATSSHRILCHTQKGDWQVIPWKTVCGCTATESTNQYYIPNAGHYAGTGLDLSDAELQLIVAVQADGHYSKDNRALDQDRVQNVRFHLQKERKISKLLDLLEDTGFEYSYNIKKDGTSDIIVNRSLYDFAEKYLNNKIFTYKLLEMNDHQRQVFIDSLLDWDDCRIGNNYSSRIQKNLDVVQAIASTSNIGTRSREDGICFTNQERTINNGGAKRNKEQDVSCVTVDTGFILIRQHGRTTIVGNCPGSLRVGQPQHDEYVARAQAWYDAMVAGKDSIDGTIVVPESHPQQQSQPAQSNSTALVSGGRSGSGFGGRYRCTVAVLNVRDAPTTNSNVVATYEKNETVTLEDWYKVVDGYVWGTYISNSGHRRYICTGPYTGKDEPDDYLVKVGSSADTRNDNPYGIGGRYKCVVSALRVRSQPNTSSSHVATYDYGESVTLDNWSTASGGYVWGTYMSATGHRRYIAVKTTGGTNYMVRV